MSLKTIRNNIISLMLLQGANYILPLLILPFLIKVLGVEKFGLLSFTLAIINFCKTTVSYGFDMTGTKMISINRENSARVSEIYSSIMIVKLAILLVVFVILNLVVMMVTKLSINYEFIMVSFIVVIGEFLFPTWFFQGMEKMAYITFLKVMGRVTYALLIFMLITSPDSYMMVPLIDGTLAVIVGLISQYIAIKKIKISIFIPNKSAILLQAKDSWHVFLSKITVLCYTSLNIIVLGAFCNNYIVGQYAIAEKIYMAIRELLTPIQQALFPHLSRLSHSNGFLFSLFVKRTVSVIFLFLVTSGAIVYFLRDSLVSFLNANGNISSNLLAIFSVTLIFSIGSFFSSLLIIQSKQKVLAKITAITMVINVLIIPPLAYVYQAYGVAIGFLIVQLMHCYLQVNEGKDLIFKKGYGNAIKSS